MIGKEDVLKLLKQALERAPGPTELVLIGGQHELTRYTRSQIHQNVASRDYTVYVKAVDGKRIGVARTNCLSVEAIVGTMERAHEMAKHQPENPYFPGLLGRSSYTPSETYFPSTPAFGPERRAEVLREVFAKARERGFEVAGSFSISEAEVAIANT